MTTDDADSVRMRVAEKENVQSAAKAAEYIRNFLVGETLPSLEDEYALVARFVPEITLDEINRMAKEWYPDTNRLVIVSAPENDFAVAEECSCYDECGDYVDAYGSAVLMIEYRDADFAEGCAAYGATHSVVRRDLDLVRAGSPAYVFDGC